MRKRPEILDVHQIGSARARAHHDRPQRAKERCWKGSRSGTVNVWELDVGMSCTASYPNRIACLDPGLQNEALKKVKETVTGPHDTVMFANGAVCTNTPLPTGLACPKCQGNTYLVTSD